MTNQQKELTQEQKTMIDGLIQEWISHGLSTQPANREMAEDAIARIYSQSKLKVPIDLFWVASPYDGCIVAARLVAGKDPLGSYTPPPEKIREQLNTCIYGQHEASWLAFYNAFQRLGVEGLDEIIPYQDLGKACGWVWPFDRAVVLCERPQAIHFDENHDLHNETGPSVFYPERADTYGEGMKVYCIHSTIVPDVLVEDPSQITVGMIKEHENTEVRRMLRQAYGNGRYLADIGAKVIDVDTVPVHSQERDSKTITRALMQDDEGNLWLIASDGSTDRVYSDLRAPRDAKTCAEAYLAITGAPDSQIVAQG